jgi:hypothetical protein
MAKVSDWLDEYWLRTRPYRSGEYWHLDPMSKAKWKQAVDKYCGAYWGRLTPEHCMRIHTRFTQMRREISDLDVEYGMMMGPNWKGVMWPYAAIAMTTGVRMDAGYLLIPGAPSCPYHVPHSLSNGAGKRGTQYRGQRTIDEMIPVVREVSGVAGQYSATVHLTRDDVARASDVRPGDCYLFDLTLGHSPRVVVENKYMGRAVQFGALDEVVDIVRCRLVFADLPSA